MLGKIGSYSTATLCSVVLHGGLIALLVGNWVPSESERKFIPPKYIDAKLLQLKAAEKPKPKPRKDNSAARKQAEAEARKKAEAKRKAEQKKKAEAKKKEAARKAAEAKKREEARKKEQARKAAEEKRRKDEQQRKALEDDLFSELNADLEGQIAENDEQIVSSYSALIIKRVENSWTRPPSARRDMRVELLIQMVPTGRVVSVTVVKSSGNTAFDLSAEQAVRKIDHFPELQQLEPRVFEQNFRKFRMGLSPKDLRL